MNPSPPMNPPQGGEAQNLTGDRVMLAAVVLSALAAVPIGIAHQTLGFVGVVGVLVFLGVGLAGYLLARATLLSRCLLAFAQVAMVAWHIQLGRGELEFHFGVFVTLALLLVYLDWRVIVLAAGLFAVHHVGFDRLQAAGFEVYCAPQADFARILLHATYVVIQTSLEVVLAVSMRRAAQAGHELGRLVSAVDRADGIDLDVRHIDVRTSSALALKNAFDRMADVVHSVKSSVVHIESASREIAQGNLDLSTRTEQAASNLQQTSASVTQINTSAQHSAEVSRQASELAASNASAAAEGGQVVGQVVSTMQAIQHSSQKIGDIIGVIDGIAFQTNILALNAAVEAARAGEQGRGFAVVASEVRNLAQRSAEAAKEIKGLIGASVDKVEQGSRLVAQAGTTIDAVVANAQRVAAAIGELTVAAREQSGGVAQVHVAVQQIDQMTQQNAALVEQGSAAAQSLQLQAEELARAVSVFRSGSLSPSR